MQICISMQDELISTAKVAALAGRTPATVNRWAREGRLEHALKMPGDTGAYLFHRADVDAFLAALQPTEKAS